MVKIRHYFITLGILLALLVVGACLDLNCSEVLFNANSNFTSAICASNYMLIIYFFLCFLGLTLFLITIPKNRGWLTWGPFVIGILLLGLSIYEYFKDLMEFGGSKYFNGTFENNIYGEVGMWIHNLVIFVALAVCVYLAYHFVFKKCDQQKVFTATKIMVVMFVLELGLSVVIKYIWSRPRPWYVFSGLDGLKPEEIFRYVYQPQPFACLKTTGVVQSSWVKSFPSGHTGRATTTFASLIVLATVFPKFDNRFTRTLLLYFATFFAIFVGFLRVLGGAHFLSDVMFGAIISITVCYFVPKFLESKKKIVFTDSNKE